MIDLLPPLHPQTLRRRHNLKHGPNGQTDRSPAEAAACHRDRFAFRLISSSSSRSSIRQLGTLTRLQYRKDNHGDKGSEELRDGGEDVMDAEIDARHAVIGVGVGIEIQSMQISGFEGNGR